VCFVDAGFTQFLARDVQDMFPQLVDNGLRMLLQLLTSWKNTLLVPGSSGMRAALQTAAPPPSAAGSDGSRGVTDSLREREQKDRDLQASARKVQDTVQVRISPKLLLLNQP